MGATEDDSATLIAPFRTAPSVALVAVDFDGTLAPIVEEPSAARPLDGAPEALERLSGVYGEVAVISGRPLEFLESWFAPASAVTLVGLYGLEVRRHGERQDHPSSGVWRETVADVAGLARLSGPADMDVELKGLSITLHYRRHPEIEVQVQEWAEEVAPSSGLRVRAAKMSVELHPPIDEDKGTVLGRLAADHTGPVLFAGDDVGDLPAFDLLDSLAGGGRPVLRVAVSSPEAPDELIGRADLVVNGPQDMAGLLSALAGD